MRGEGPPDFTELVLDACARLLSLSDLGVGVDEGRARAEAAVADGSAHALYERGSRLRAAIHRSTRFRRPRSSAPSTAPRDGTVVRLGAIAVGIAALELGAGRATKESEIDHAVGVVCLAKRGHPVAAGETLAEVHARGRGGRRGAAAAVLAAYELGDQPPREHPILLDVLST